MAELRTLPGDLADAVARLLVATGLEADPERAYQYAEAARGLAARVGIVRETAAIAAYQAGRWTDALAEFRAARRLTGRNSYLPLMADCERALGRVDRALDIVSGPEARSADRATQIELRIVESGIRRDQGLPEAGVVALQVPELTEKRGRASHARLFYAYADALLDAGREEEAREWFGKAAAADSADETDAAERVDELDNVLFEDLDDEDDLDEDESAEFDDEDDEDDLDDEEDAADEDESDADELDAADEDEEDEEDEEDLDKAPAADVLDADADDDEDEDEDELEGDLDEAAAADVLDDDEDDDVDDLADADIEDASESDGEDGTAEPEDEEGHTGADEPAPANAAAAGPADAEGASGSAEAG